MQSTLANPPKRKHPSYVVFETIGALTYIHMKSKDIAIIDTDALHVPRAILGGRSIAECSWSVQRQSYAGTILYANGGAHYVYLHDVILPARGELQADHRNMDKLDNRRSNLRRVTDSINKMNKGCYKNNRTGYKGVSWSSVRDKWRAQLIWEKTRYHLGLYDCPREAAAAYDAKAEELLGSDAYLNFGPRLPVLARPASITGVSWSMARSMWRARSLKTGKSLGYYRTRSEAVAAQRAE